MTMTKGVVSEEETPKNQEAANQLASNEMLEIVKNLQDEIKTLKSKETQGGMTSQDISNIANIIAETNKKLSEKPLDYHAGIAVEQIPLEDYQEKAVRFCAPISGYIVSDDIRKGHRVTLPFGKPFIFFEYIATRRSQVGKFEQLAHISAYETHSKKEIEWLRSHTLYGAMFFENSTDASNIDLAKVNRIGTIMRNLQSMEFNDLVKRCHENGLTPNEDAAIMRGNIAVKLVEKEIANERSRSETVLLNTQKDEMLLGRK